MYALPPTPTPLLELVQELVDTQLDTLEMALELEPDEEWASHCEYLRRLVREANGVLARLL